MVSIQEAAEFLGVSAQTLRRWERQGRPVPAERTAGGRRRYDLALLKPELFHAQADTACKTIAYARVSSHDQKDVQEIITVFNARLYGSRSRKNQKLLEGVKKAVEDA